MSLLVGGVIVPIVTPMHSDGSPFSEAASLLLERLAGSGVDAVMVAGSTGEGHALDVYELANFVGYVDSRWRQLTGGSGRLFVTVSAPSTREAHSRARAVIGHRPAGLVVSPPYYFRYTEDELRDFYLSFAGFAVPIIAYNVPRYTGNPLTSELITELAQMEHVAGIKDSSGDRAILEHECAVASSVAQFGVAQGDEDQLVSALKVGAAGIVPGVGNIAPTRCVALYRAARVGDWAAAEAAQEDLRRLAAIHRIRRGVAVTKAALHTMGLCPPYVSEPFRQLTAAETDQLRRLLRGLADVIGPDVEKALA